MLVFRRLREGDAQEFQPELLPAPSATLADNDQPIEMHFENEDASDKLFPENGVEDTQTDASIGASLSILARARNGAAPTKATESEKDAKPSV